MSTRHTIEFTTDDYEKIEALCKLGRRLGVEYAMDSFEVDAEAPDRLDESGERADSADGAGT